MVIIPLQTKLLTAIHGKLSESLHGMHRQLKRKRLQSSEHSHPQSLSVADGNTYERQKDTRQSKEVMNNAFRLNAAVAMVLSRERNAI